MLNRLEKRFTRGDTGRNSTTSDVEVNIDTKLCDVCHEMCKQIVKRISKKRNMRLLANEHDGYNETFSMPYWNYHKRWKDVRDAVTKGCALCTILSAGLDSRSSPSSRTFCLVRSWRSDQQSGPLAFYPDISSSIHKKYTIHLEVYTHGLLSPDCYSSPPLSIVVAKSMSSVIVGIHLVLSISYFPC